MASGIHGKFARLAKMDWREIQVRLSQELHKRADLLRHQAGLPPASIKLDVDPSQPGRFFFSASEAQARAEVLRHSLPDETASILHEADEVCAHRFRLLGYDNLDYGPEIDWHLDRVHDKRAPLQPWFEIPFLDFAAVGDHKVTWELNRHQHFITLAKARLLTGDEKYSRELHAQWHHWMKANPYPLGINWGSSLEVAFRGFSWIWVDHLLAGTPDHKLFRRELLSALAFHGRYIERYLSTYFSPNTHFLGEAVALFFLGTLYPQMPHAARWKRKGWQIVLHETGRQVRPDGIYFEQSLYYHVYALDFFLHARLLAALNAIEIPAAYDAVLQRMIEVVAALAQAGPPEGFGDDDGGRLFQPRHNRTEHMVDPLATGALVYARDLPAAQLTEESIWLFGQATVERLPPLSVNARAGFAPRSAAFTEGGLYVLAAPEPFAQTIVLDAGPQGVGRCGHGHADALSLRLTMNQRRWLVDSGSGVYIARDPADRNTFRGTGAHNTLRIDGLDQAVPDEPFSWTNIPAPQAQEWVVGKTFSYFVGSHNGYESLPDPVTHRRFVLQVANGVCLVRDVVIGKAEHDLELRWHFAPDLELQKMSEGKFGISPGKASPADPALALLLPAGSAWETGTEPTRTLLSPAYGAYQPCPLLRSQVRVKLPAETAIALVTQTVAALNEPTRLASMTHAKVQLYQLDHGNETQAFFFALTESAWHFGPWSSNCTALYCRIQNEKLAHLIVIGGTHVAYQDEPLLKGFPSSRFFEWRHQNAKIDDLHNSGSQNFSVTPWFEKITGGNSVVSGNSTFAEKH